MGILDSWFGKKRDIIDNNGFEAHLGRFSDVYKTPDQYNAWDKSVEYFEKHEYEHSLIEFLHYLNNPDKDNVILNNQQNIKDGFELVQGSKSILGKIKNGRLLFTVEVAYVEHLHIGFMRRLLDLNYELKYVRYGLSDSQMITLLFDTMMEDAFPYKLYYALKELALHADKHDDLLLNEFDFLKPISSHKLKPLSEKEKAFKLAYYRTILAQAMQQVEKGRLKPDQYPAANSYILLAALYKLDYLIKPEGSLIDAIEKVHKSYFGPEQKNQHQKLNQLSQEFAKLSRLTDPFISNDLYNGIFTFGVTSPANMSMIKEIIEREFRNIGWYIDNQYPEYAIAIVEYTVGLCLFNHAVPSVIRKLFTIVYRITEPDYFITIQNHPPLVDPRGQVDKQSIKTELTRIEKEYKSEYPALVLDSKLLSYESICHFVYSFVMMISRLSMSKSR